MLVDEQRSAICVGLWSVVLHLSLRVIQRGAEWLWGMGVGDLSVLEVCMGLWGPFLVLEDLEGGSERRRALAPAQGNARYEPRHIMSRLAV